MRRGDAPATIGPCAIHGALKVDGIRVRMKHMNITILDLAANVLELQEVKSRDDALFLAALKGA